VADFIAACTQSPVNLVLSVLLALTMTYWIVVLVGAVGLDSLDFDFDLDTDVDVDVDPQSGLLAGGFGVGILQFFHIGTVPILVLWSFFIFVLWSIGVLTWPLIGEWGAWLQLLAIIPMWITAIFVTKIFTLPLVKVFKQMEAQAESETNLKLVGRRCTIVSLTANHRHGQAEMATSGAPLKLNVRTRDEQTTLKKGDEVVLTEEDQENRIYFVQRF